MIARIALLIDGLAQRDDLTVSRHGEASLITISRSAWTYEITVPHDVLEWFASIRRGDEEIWSDWADYDGYGPAPHDRLADAMAADIAAFVERTCVAAPGGIVPMVAD